MLIIKLTRIAITSLNISFFIAEIFSVNKSVYSKITKKFDFLDKDFSKIKIGQVKVC